MSTNFLKNLSRSRSGVYPLEKKHGTVTNGSLLEKIIRKIALVILVFALIGCAGLQLSPEAQRVISVTNTTGCQFIKDMYIETYYPESLTYTLQWHTYNAGGDAYQIISQVKFTNFPGPFSKKFSMSDEKAMTTHFEIYKCKP